MRTSSRGYSLLEVIVVVAILGLLSAVSVPNFLRWLHSYRLQSAAAGLSNHLRAIRLLAILKSQEHQLQVKDANEGNYYQAVEDPEGEDRIVISIGRVILDKEFKEVIITDTNKEGRFSFYPKGTSTSGSITLENSLGERIKISIANGRVRSEYL